MPSGSLSATLGADPPPDTPAEIAAALRDDPILVSTILGNGATAAIHRELHVKLDSAQYPVFVVLAPTPPDLDRLSADEDLASLIHAELGQDGVYFVHTSQGIGHLAVHGDVDPSVTNDETLVSLARYTALDQVRDEVLEQWGADARVATAAEAGVLLDVAARETIPDYGDTVLTEDEVAAYGAAQWHTIGYHYVPPPPAVSAGTVLAVALGVVVAVLAFRSLGRLRLPSLTGSSPARQAPPPADAELLAEARRELAELEEELEHPRSRWVDRDLLVVAQASRGHAHALVVDPATTPTDLDAVGALVLVRSGLHSLRAPSSDDRYTCCFVNPLHGRARHRADLPGGLGVPTCGPCRRDLQAGTPPDALMERRGEQERPYYAGDSIWAETGYGALVDDLSSALSSAPDGTVRR